MSGENALLDLGLSLTIQVQAFFVRHERLSVSDFEAKSGH